MKNIAITALFVLTVVFLLPGILCLKIDYLPGRKQPSFPASKKIFADQALSFQLTAKKNYLAGIGVSIRNPNLINRQDMFLTVEDLNNNVVATTVINGWSIQDGEYIKFMTSPIIDSENRKYKVTFSSPDSKETNALEIYLDEEGIPAYVDIYETTSRQSLIQAVYKGWHSELVKDKIFAGIYLMILAICLVGVVI